MSSSNQLYLSLEQTNCRATRRFETLLIPLGFSDSVKVSKSSVVIDNCQSPAELHETINLNHKPFPHRECSFLWDDMVDCLTTWST